MMIEEYHFKRQYLDQKISIDNPNIVEPEENDGSHLPLHRQAITMQRRQPSIVDKNV